MTERTLRSKSVSIVRGVDELVQEIPVIGTDARETGKENELDRTRVEANVDINIETVRQEMAHTNSSDTAVMLARQFQEFMITVRKEFGDLKAEMKAENAKLAESIKTASDEMAIKMEIANKSLSDSLTKQFRDENEILRMEFSSELNAEVLTLMEKMNQ